MRTAFRRSFERDLSRLRDETLRRRIREAIEQVEAAENLQDVPKLRQITGFRGCYRIRIGDYRLGIAVEGDEVEFVRCLHRRDIYRYFP